MLIIGIVFCNCILNIFFFFFRSQHLLQLFNNFTPYTQPYFQEAHWEFVGKFLSSIWLRSCKPWVCTVNDLLSSFPFLSEVRVTPSLVLYVCFVIVICPFVLFLLAIVFSVLLRFTDSDYLFGIFKLFLIYFYIFTVLYF